MHSLRSSRHLFQFMSKSALPEVSLGRSRSLAGKASPGTSSDPLRASGLPPAPSFGPVGLAEQEGPLRSPVSYQCGNPSRSGARFETSRCRNRLLQRAAHRELKLDIHPHVHCVVPAGGLSPNHTHWVSAPQRYFLPREVLRKVFRGKFVDEIGRASCR